MEGRTDPPPEGVANPKKSQDVVPALRVWKLLQELWEARFWNPWVLGALPVPWGLGKIFNSRPCSLTNSRVYGCEPQQSGALNHFLSMMAIISFHLLNLQSFSVSLAANPEPGYLYIWERSSWLSEVDTVQTTPDTEPDNHTPWFSSDTAYPCRLPPTQTAKVLIRGSQCRCQTPLGA